MATQLGLPTTLTMYELKSFVFIAPHMGWPCFPHNLDTCNSAPLCTAMCTYDIPLLWTITTRKMHGNKRPWFTITKNHHFFNQLDEYFLTWYELHHTWPLNITVGNECQWLKLNYKMYKGRNNAARPSLLIEACSVPWPPHQLAMAH